MAEDLKDIKLRSEEVQEILTAVPNWMIRWGNTAMLLLILGLLAISWLVSYPDVIPSQAVVTTMIPPEKEYANTAGKIDTILVIDGQIVTEDTPLAIIENSSNFKDVLYLKTITDTLSINKKEFVFPSESLPLLFLGDIENDFAIFENDYQKYKLNKQLKPFDNEALANSASISELRFRLNTLRSQKKLNKSELNLKVKERDRDKTLFKKGVISAQEYETSQASFLQSESSFANNDASISQTLEALSNANKTAKGTAISSTKEEITLLKNVLQSFNKLKRSIIDWERRYLIKSNIQGSVTFLNFWSTNQTVAQNDLLFTVIPSEDGAYIAKLKTPAQNSGKIKTGQKVQLRLQDYPDNEYGVLEGTISRISAVTDEQGFYLIDVKLPETLITTYKKEIVFKQEMQASATIITEDLRLIERFFYQLKDIFKN